MTILYAIPAEKSTEILCTPAHPSSQSQHPAAEPLPLFQRCLRRVDIADAIDMAADAIGLWGITTQDMGKDIPAPSASLPEYGPGEIAAFALVDFDAYCRANDMRTIRKNVTLPSYLNDMAEKARLNFSQVLQDALKEKLRVN